MTLWCGIHGPHGGQRGQRHERQRRVLLPRRGPPEPVLRGLDRRPSGADCVASVTHIGWMVSESGVCILLTRRREEMQYWVDLGCTAVPLYAVPPL
jgi:hypothetical protein